ncbi:MAG: glycosyltransferase [Chloroflexaceae bacterium]|jgi:glycosyltransferase involved in cell wall biosynthesis|nr:glycosyltransferase [Chloroflexaceae bacterium]
MKISLICTVRDEADNIGALLDSMLAQTRPPDEIVVNDNLSRDATPQVVREYAAREPRIKLVSGGHNIPSGRNNAIRHASGQIVACTDAGLTLEPTWLAELVQPIEAGRADQVGGFFVPAPQSLFELALGATNFRHPEEIEPAKFLPFGNSMAFRKEVWVAVGGFPEWLSHSEDLVFDQAIERAGFRRAFAPTALVRFRPRESLGAFYRQYVNYARGDARAGLWPMRHAIRYGTYVALLLLLLGLGWRKTRMAAALLLLAGLAAYTRAPYRRLWPQTRHLPPLQRLYTLALVPLIRITGDVGKMVGYASGFKRET